MTVKTVLKMGHPVLRQIAEPVIEFNTPALDALVEDMFETMRSLNGAGLAAPQIGVSQRVVIFSVQSNPRYPDVEVVPKTILINPEIAPARQLMDEEWEGCLSVPGLRGRVPRFTEISYRGFDAQGNFFERDVSGFHARVVQHEVDHLDGILYPQRMQDLQSLCFEEELSRHGF